MFLGTLSLVVLFSLAHSNISHHANALNGKHLIVGTGNFPPTIGIVVNATGSIVKCSGKLYEEIEWLSKRLNFSYELRISPENTAGVKVKGTWIGLIGQIQRKEVDLALGPFAVSLQRFEAIDFVGYTGGTGVSMLVKYPPSKTSPNATVKPFTVEIWIGWLASIIVATLVTHLIKLFWEKHDSSPKNLYWDTGDMFMYLLANMAAQGEYYRPSFRATGLVAMIWCFAAFVFVNSYSSTLASFLLVTYTAPDINSIESLASSTSPVVVLKGSIGEEDILNSTSGSFRVLANRLLKCPRCRSTDFLEIRRMVLSESFVGILPTSSALGMILTDLDESKKCRLTLANVNYGWMPMYFGVRKNSEFESELTLQSLWIDAHGLISMWKAAERFPRQCILKYNRKGISVQSFSASLTLRQFYPPFFILIFGYVFASVAFIFERARAVK